MTATETRIRERDPAELVQDALHRAQEELNLAELAVEQAVAHLTSANQLHALAMNLLSGESGNSIPTPPLSLGLRQNETLGDQLSLASAPNNDFGELFLVTDPEARES